MPNIAYAAHVQRARQVGAVPLSISQFIRLVNQIYRMERQTK